MGRSDMRRAARHRAYTIVTFMCVAIIGVGMVYLVRGAWSKRAQKVRTVLYRDPVYVLRDIFAKEETAYRGTRGGSYASLEQLVKADMILDEFATGPVEGYRYRVALASSDDFLVTAERDASVAPANSQQAAAKRFYSVDQTHTIRNHDSPLPGPDAEIVWSPRDQGPR